MINISGHTHAIRRKDRALTTENAWALLNSEAVGRLAIATPQGEPYIVPLNHVVIDNIIYFHCATIGRKLDIIRENPKACYEVDRFLGIKEGPAACNYSAYYESALAFGEAFEVIELEQKVDILNQLTRRHAGPLASYSPVTPEQARHVAVIGIRVDGVAGKSRPIA